MKRLGVKWLGATLLLAAIVLLGLAAGQLRRWRTFMDQPAELRPARARPPGTQLVVLGTTHAPQPNFTPDSLYAALERLRPDVILFEIDSSRIGWVRQPPGLMQALTTTLGGAAPENEGQAVRKYLRWHPATALQPYEWNRRDAFHRQYGILTEPGKVSDRLAQLRAAGQLLPWQLRTLVAYDSLNARLNALARQPLDSLNTPAADSLAARRQGAQYHGLGRVVAAHPALAAFRAFYRINEAYWDIRNRAMARNVAARVTQYPGRRLVVLAGFNHRYYLLRELRPRQADLGIKVLEYTALGAAEAAR